MKQSEVIVLGAGHNGLVAAALMAQAGARVTVFERRSTLGGLAGTIDVGERSGAIAAADLGLFRADLAQRLGLAAHGWDHQERGAQAGDLIAWRAPNAGDRTLGNTLRLFTDLGRLVDAVGEHSKHDAAQMPRFLETVARLSTPFEAVLRTSANFRDAAAIARQPELMRFVSASLQNLLGWWFESDAVRVALAGLALQNTGLGPRDQGTGWLLLYQLAGTTSRGFRPAVVATDEPGTFVTALASAARSLGVVIHDRLGATRLLTKDGCQCGVRLDDGTVVRANVVISTLDAPATLLGLVGASHLPVRAVRALRRLRMEGSTVRALSLLPRPLHTRTVVAESLDDIQKAQDWARRGVGSVNPWLLCDGASINAHYLPYRVCEDPQAVATFRQAVVSAMERSFGGAFANRDAQHLWLSPAAFHQHLGATQGTETGGWMSLDQSLVLRPMAGWSGVATPIKGLLLGGAAAHPGGGVTGLPGLAAAEQAQRLL